MRICCKTPEQHAEHTRREELIKQKAAQAERRKCQNTLNRSKKRGQETLTEHLDVIATLRKALADEKAQRETFERALEQARARAHRLEQGTELSKHAWGEFIKLESAIASLDADMEQNGLHFTVPELLLPVYHQILREVFFTQPGEEDTKTAVRAKGVLAAAGFHFFNSILGRKGQNQFNGLQKQMAVLMQSKMPVLKRRKRRRRRQSAWALGVPKY